MTAEEKKAFELIDKFKTYTYTTLYPTSDEIDPAKECALILINEILSEQNIDWNKVKVAVNAW